VTQSEQFARPHWHRVTMGWSMDGVVSG